jgi:hypothetical protein
MSNAQTVPARVLRGQMRTIYHEQMFSGFSGDNRQSRSRPPSFRLASIRLVKLKPVIVSELD